MDRQLKKVIKHPRYILARVLAWYPINRLFSDERYLKLMYCFRTGKVLNWENPVRFNEKIQRLKLLNNSEHCSTLVDKVGVKEYVTEKLGEGFVIPTIGVYDSFDQIQLADLPNSFVIKTTHDSGTIVVVKNKYDFNSTKARKIISKSLSRNYYWAGREYPYKNVKPRVIVEQYMADKSGGLNDYKFFCFNGEPKYLFYASDRSNPLGMPPKFDFYDMDLKHLPIVCNGHENASKPLDYFPEFDQMKHLAAVLSAGFPHVRVDFYLIDKRVYVGELTFHHDGGFVSFIPDEWDYIFGKSIVLDDLIKQ